MQILTQKKIHQNADNNFKNNIATAFTLESKAYEVFESSKIAEKRNLIAFMFLGLKLNEEKLVFTVVKPFDKLLKMQDCVTWLPLGTTLRTESYGYVIQYGQKLKLMKVDLRELQLVA